jgi:uracil-DNA glycosylase
MGEIHGIEYKWINPLSGKMYSIFPTYHPSALIRKNGAFNPEKLNYLDEVVVKDIMECWMPF